MYTLTWQPPYDWQWMFGFLSARAVAGVETVTDHYYERSFACEGHQGIFRVTPDSQTPTLTVTLSPGLIPVAQTCLERIGRLFDLDCDPQAIRSTLGDLGAARPGLRLPGAMDAWEQGVRAILGQLVSVAMAAKLASRVVALCGEPVEDAPGYLCFPTPHALAAADPLALKALGMPVKRAESIVHLAQSVVDGTFPLSPPADIEAGMKALQQRPGIGRWTANYLALRGWQAKDVFLPDDYLIKQRFAGMTPAQIRRYAQRWHPWRSYALLHIWYTDGWAPSVDGEIAGIKQ
ncbi:TPA: DNA-3-methyladenine glycosylase 2 [Enterobacter ludwigii]|uniref:DNA-3-methyladenine glycosylase 2 n=1 Tax=Enterobacter ludwigii TaxID=299767 RepID=UPI001E643BBC|nr:DNA-3-methyladenine glycosylase 2 [Enterobacter ludwigii]MCE1917444.1 DNA-3-methyladenine glycosylase 2 [Enterobacter ludwigii]HDR2590416.1 DNA-3-methyladenine glycosylase 2 [Enterobacter ludwigii]HDR2600067.1 DNA-3-methyladenine glycosylase 2 [Enterobacter ludwigii]